MAPRKPTDSFTKQVAPGRRVALKKISARLEDSSEFQVVPNEALVVVPHLAGFKSGDKAWFPVRWSKPVDPNCDLVDAAIQIIRPSKEKKAQCRKFVADSMQLLRMLPNDQFGPYRKLTQLMKVSRKVSSLLAKLPRSVSDALLPDPLNESDFDNEIRQGVPVRLQKRQRDTSRCDKLRDELEFLANNIDLSSPKGKRGPKLDFMKSNAVHAAYNTLIQFSSSVPTTTAGGPFYELSSIFYEAVEGSAGVSMERQCRKFLKSGLALTN